MRIIVSLAVLAAVNVWAQGQAPSPSTADKAKAGAQAAASQQSAAPAKPNTIQVNVPGESIVPITSLPPATVVATIDGRKVTAGELQVVIRQMPPQYQQKIQADPRTFVEQYGLLLRLSADARKEKLDQQSPYKEEIEYATMSILQRAEFSRKTAELPVPADDVKKAYDSKKDKYAQAKVKAIYLQYSSAPESQADVNGKMMLTEAQAKSKADDLVKQLRAGADFTKLVKENSDDKRSAEKGGDLGVILKSNPGLPAEVKNAIFAAKPGDTTDPIRLPNGFWICRVEEFSTQPFEQVKGTIEAELRSAQVGPWVKALQKSIDIKMEHEGPAGVQVVPQASNSTVPPAK
jgi:peptidyl-prolyl cis-trans isomerase C